MFKLNVRRPLIVLVFTAAVASIAACGGSNDGGVVGGGTVGPGGTTPAVTSVPASALASVDGLIAFMNQLIDSGTNETGEPIALGDASLPVDDAI